MKIHRSVNILTLSTFLVGIGFAASLKTSQQKSLPLDCVRNVIMKSKENSLYMPGRVIVKLNSPIVLSKAARSTGLPNLDSYIQHNSIQSIESAFPDNIIDRSGKKIDLSKFYVLKYTSPMDAFKMAEELSQLPEIQYAEPWFIYTLDNATACSVNDPNRNLQWGLTKILADSAWCISTGDTSIVIGIIDSGIQWDHPDLAANIYINPGEYGPDGHGGLKQSNGIDDDGNGKIDDWHGWDFGGADVNNPVEDNNPYPPPTGGEHGTHVAGIASAVTNNSIGVAGLGYKCKLLPVKTVSDNDPTHPYYGMQGIVYAAMMGARIINCSWGGPGASQVEQEIIDSVTAHGSLVVAAAGNSGTNQIQYPASYRGVISVAATATIDAKAYYSTYNEFVDVSAPGDNIWSTYYPSNYAYLSGTSMATPLVSGLAALVAAHFPSYTNLQIGEQVRVSCDDINSINPSYANLLGKGRINAYKALTLSSPSLRMMSIIVKDSIGGNNNGVLEPNENGDLVITFMNYLQATSSAAMITLSTADTNIQIINSNYPIGVLGTYGTATNNLTPFQVHVKSNVPPGQFCMFKLTITDGSYNDVQLFSLLVNPTFATHNINNVEVTLTNIGRIGFVDNTNNYGVGFVYGGGNQLYEGGLMVGYSATKLVDVVRNQNALQDNDFTSSQIYSMLTPGILSAQDGSAIFTDDAASPINKIGLQVKMYSYAFNSVADSNYIILRYDIKNNSGGAIPNLYAGLFFDWDILGNQINYYNYNKTTFDSTQNIGYAWNQGTPNTVYCGARAFGGNVNYYGMINNPSLTYDRASKWQWLSTGIHKVDSVADIHFAISSGPFSLNDSATQMIGFALIGGKSLFEFQNAATAAFSKWNYIKGKLGVEDGVVDIPRLFALKQNYPNPFNPVTQINYDLPHAVKVSLKVFDLLGREVTTLVNEEQPAGEYSVSFDATKLASGMYFYRLNAGEFTDVKKLLLLK